MDIKSDKSNYTFIGNNNNNNNGLCKFINYLYWATKINNALKRKLCFYFYLNHHCFIQKNIFYVIYQLKRVYKKLYGLTPTF